MVLAITDLGEVREVWFLATALAVASLSFQNTDEAKSREEPAQLTEQANALTSEGGVKFVRVMISSGAGICNKFRPVI